MHMVHTKIPAMQQSQINLVTDWTPGNMRVLLKKCCEVSWDTMIADCFLFWNLSVFLHFGCLGRGFACLAIEPYCLCSDVPLVQLYLSLTLKEVILLHSLVFTLVHTTSHVHNNKWRHFWDSALELGSWPPFQQLPEHFTPLVTSRHLQTMRLDFGLICIHGASQVSPHRKYCSISFRILLDEQSNAHWKPSEVCLHTINFVQTKLEIWKHTFCKSTG